jgi:hypothetical protein
LDVLRQHKTKTKINKKTVDLNQWFFHANPDTDIVIVRPTVSSICAFLAFFEK